MMLRSVEGRVLACLIEKETTVPDSYPLTMKAVLTACNQSSNRDPVTAYDERTVTEALDALKNDGLVRFVHPSHGGRTLRYRHVADERWELGRGPLGVLALLILRGPETHAALRTRSDRHLSEGETTIDDALAELTAAVEPLVRLLDRAPGEREARYTQLLVDVHPVDEATNEMPAVDPVAAPPHESGSESPPSAEPELGNDPALGDSPQADETAEMVDAVLDELRDLRRRVERLERLFDG